MMYGIRVYNEDGSWELAGAKWTANNKTVVERWINNIFKTGKSPFGEVKDAQLVPMEAARPDPRKWDSAVAQYGFVETWLIVEHLFYLEDLEQKFAKYYRSELHEHPATDLLSAHYHKQLLAGDPDQETYMMKRFIQCLLAETKVANAPSTAAPESVFKERCQPLSQYFEPLKA